MKSTLSFFILFLTLCLQVIASEDQIPNHERFLKNFGVQEIDNIKKVFFILDNDWVFTSEISSAEEHKLYSLDKLLNSRALIKTQSQLLGLEITFENPFNKGYNKISFQGTITKETYESSLVITDIEIETWWLLFSDTVITLSDGSKWKVVDAVDGFVNYYSIGDHIMMTLNFSSAAIYSFVNLDISKRSYFKYHRSKYSMWPAEDPRNIDVTFYQNPSN